MTAIQKMVEWLEKSAKINRLRREDYVYQDCIKEARRLAAEEGKECPQKDNVHAACSSGESEHTKEKPASDLWGQHKQMVKLAQDHGLHLAANWAVNMSGKTFSEEKPTAPAELVEDEYDKWLCDEINNDVYEKGYKTYLLRARAMYRKLHRPASQADIVLWEGLVKTGEPGLNMFKGHGEYESTVLFSVDYAKLKGQKGQLIFRKYEGDK